MSLARLHPHLQHAIVHDLGWRSLRPVQDLTIDTVLDGANTIHHSSVSREERELAEQQFATGHNTAIVCTATMELGIDVGDLDQVLIALDARLRTPLPLFEPQS